MIRRIAKGAIFEEKSHVLDMPTVIETAALLVIAVGIFLITSNFIYSVIPVVFMPVGVVYYLCKMLRKKELRKLKKTANHEKR